MVIEIGMATEMETEMKAEIDEEGMSAVVSWCRGINEYALEVKIICPCGSTFVLGIDFWISAFGEIVTSTENAILASISISISTSILTSSSRDYALPASFLPSIGRVSR